MENKRNTNSSYLNVALLSSRTLIEFVPIAVKDTKTLHYKWSEDNNRERRFQIHHLERKACGLFRILIDTL